MILECLSREAGLELNYQYAIRIPAVTYFNFPRSVLIRQLKESQHNLMNVIMSIADLVIPDQRASRDFRAKYPDDVLLDQISGEFVASYMHFAESLQQE